MASFFLKQPSESDHYYTRSVTPKRVTSGGVHHRVLARGQHSSEETFQRLRAVGDTVSNFTALGIEPHTFRTDRDV